MSKEKLKGFEYKCTCYWSKNDEFGFVPNLDCEVHGKETRERLNKSVSWKKEPVIMTGCPEEMEELFENE